MSVFCSICVEHFSSASQAATIGECGHVFHNECLDLFLASENTACPECRDTFSGKQRKRLYLNVDTGNDVYGVIVDDLLRKNADQAAEITKLEAVMAKMTEELSKAEVDRDAFRIVTKVFTKEVKEQIAKNKKLQVEAEITAGEINYLRFQVRDLEEKRDRPKIKTPAKRRLNDVEMDAACKKLRTDDENIPPDAEMKQEVIREIIQRSPLVMRTSIGKSPRDLPYGKGSLMRELMSSCPIRSIFKRSTL